MAKIETFDLINSTLTGVNLIEASAGTGKTYTITGIVLRLVAEDGVDINRILVVTFTEAATAELKDRIRKRLRDGLAVICAGADTDDDFLRALAESVETKTAVRRIQDALRDFDDAAIFTIHGFCKRMLSENAFESGILFDTELITDPSEMVREAAADFWRANLYESSRLLSDYVRKRTGGPDGLQALLGKVLGKPDMRIIPEPPKTLPDLDGLDAAFQPLYQAVRSEWHSARGSVEKLLIETDALKLNMYGKDAIPKWLSEMDGYFAPATGTVDLPKNAGKFTPEGLIAGLKKGKRPPEHPFFDQVAALMEAAEDLREGLEAHLLALKHRLFVECRAALRKGKSARNVQSFDDLLLNLHDALEGDSGAELAEKIRDKYKAALIDEFQDTDPVQYRIFQRIFDHPGHSLFMIGDPKQAIYGFRGADIFAYMNAAKRAERRYTLGTNYRSEPGLIRAVNAVFESHPDNPFVYKDIPFQAVDAPKNRSKPAALSLDGKGRPPLEIWTVDVGEKKINKDEAEGRIIRATAYEISRLLDGAKAGRALLGERPVSPGDIAVLVRKNSEAEAVRRALFQLGIPSVRHATGDVFDTPEAAEMERFLMAAAHPRSEGAIRAALATALFGMDGNAIDRLSTVSSPTSYEDETGLDEWFARFDAYRETWERRGFIRMFRGFLREMSVLPRLMAFPDGERRCTNLLHLSELLHQAEARLKPGTDGLVKWFSERRHDESRRAEEQPPRLESDEHAVRLVTIHKSKGLEYPVVFCPFTWSASTIRNDGEEIGFHDPEADFRWTLDLGSEAAAAHKALAEKEVLAENMRLLYVALTRAKNRCYWVWGRFNTAESSAPAYLLHGGKLTGEPLVETLKNHFKTVDDDGVREALMAVRERSEETVHVAGLPDADGIAYTPEEEASVELDKRPFRETITRQYRIASFTGLVAHQRPFQSPADRDALRVAPPPVPVKPEAVEEATPTIFDFPKGAIPGTCLHAIFEEIDFHEEAKGGTLSETVEAVLGQYGFAESWTEPVTTMARNVLSTPLSGPDGPFRLSDIPANDVVKEMEFHHPLQRISPESLKAAISVDGADAALSETVERLDFAPVQGYMRGFIDLILRWNGRFYVLDWKSNHLGDTPEAYGPDALSRVMREEGYTLQYYIYLLALHRYLRQRLPGYAYDDAIGGVFYLFLRGMTPDAPEMGVFRAFPAREEIERLDRLLIGSPHE